MSSPVTPKSKILLTGGCGFIGLNLLSYLLKQTTSTFHILDNLSTSKRSHLKPLETTYPRRITFFKGDIRNTDDVTQAINGCTHLVHLAAHTDVIQSTQNPQKDADININGTLTILDSAVKHNIHKIVFSSSAAPLGNQPPPAKETQVPQPMSAYGASKLACEGYLSAYAHTHQLPAVALRFSNVYGPHSYTKGSVIAAFIRQLLQDTTPTIYGDGNQTRDFIHATDIARAIHLALTTDLAEPFTLIQIATQQETTINTLYQIIKQQLKQQGYHPSNADHAPPRPGEIYRNYADITKAKKNLGFTPTIHLEEGIHNTINWFITYHDNKQ